MGRPKHARNNAVLFLKTTRIKTQFKSGAVSVKYVIKSGIVVQKLKIALWGYLTSYFKFGGVESCNDLRKCGFSGAFTLRRVACCFKAWGETLRN